MKDNGSVINIVVIIQQYIVKWFCSGVKVMLNKRYIIFLKKIMQFRIKSLYLYYIKC